MGEESVKTKRELARRGKNVSQLDASRTFHLVTATISRILQEIFPFLRY